MEKLTFRILFYLRIIGRSLHEEKELDYSSEAHTRMNPKF